MKYRKNLLAVLVAVALANSLVACSSDDNDDNDPTGDTTGDTTGDNNGGNTNTDTTADISGMFESTSYVGYRDPNGADWTEGWTVSVHGNDSVWEPAVTPVADATCPAGTTYVSAQALPDINGDGVSDGEMDLCQMAGRYTSDVALTNDNIYLLASGTPGTLIGDGDAESTDRNFTAVNLDIAEGTLILGSAQEALVITRGSTVNAMGTAENPIVMSSTTQFANWINGDATSGRGEWAGFALMGQAKEGRCTDDDFANCNVVAEGGIGYYGGENDNDNSGTVEYVVVRHAGNDLDGNGNELNGFTLFGVGAGTTLNHIQVHNGLDDGVEHFGSADFMSHVVLTGNGDDSFDWGHGYTGGIQYLLIQQAEDAGDHGIEADNNSSPMDDAPRSEPTIRNMTIIGSTTSDNAIRLRRGTGAHISYSEVTAQNDEGCFEVHDGETLALANTQLTVDNTTLNCPVPFNGENSDGAIDLTTEEVEAFFTAGTGNVVNSN